MTAVENWAESATTETPHTIPSASVSTGGAPNRKPIGNGGRAADGHGRHRQGGAAHPVGDRAGHDAADPAGADDEERREAREAGSTSPAAAKLAAKNAGIHVHIA